MPSPDELWDEAHDLALQWGCEPESLCWTECLDDAYDTVEARRDMRSEYRFNSRGNY